MSFRRINELPKTTHTNKKKAVFAQYNNRRGYNPFGLHGVRRKDILAFNRLVSKLEKTGNLGKRVYRESNLLENARVKHEVSLSIIGNTNKTELQQDLKVPTPQVTTPNTPRQMPQEEEFDSQTIRRRAMQRSILERYNQGQLERGMQASAAQPQPVAEAKSPSRGQHLGAKRMVRENIIGMTPAEGMRLAGTLEAPDAMVTRTSARLKPEELRYNERELNARRVLFQDP